MVGRQRDEAFDESRAFMEDVARHECALLRKSYGTTAEDEEEMASTALLAAYRAMARFQPARSSLRTFLYSVIRNSVRWSYAHLDRRRQDAFERSMDRAEGDDAPEHGTEDQDHAMAQLLASLPEDVAVYCRMRMDGHTDEEAREVLGVKRGFWTDFRRRVRESLRGPTPSP